MEGSGMAAVLDGIGGFGDGGDGDGGDGGDGGEEEPSVVYYCLEESTGYMQPALRALAVAHTIVAFLCIIGYNCLKVRPPKAPPKPPQSPWHSPHPQPAFLCHAPRFGHAPSPSATPTALILSRHSDATPLTTGHAPLFGNAPWPRPLCCPPCVLALFGHTPLLATPLFSGPLLLRHAPSLWPRPRSPLATPTVHNPSRQSETTPPFLATPTGHPWPRPLLCPPCALALLSGHAPH